MISQPQGNSMEQYEEEQPDRRGWRLDRRVSITHILTTLSAIAIALTFAAEISKRVALLEQGQTMQDRETTEFKAQVRDSLQAISNKLDRLIDKVPNGSSYTEAIKPGGRGL